MGYSVLLLTLFLSVRTAWTLCPDGCDCLPDPALPSSLSLHCKWSGLPLEIALPNGTRNLHISCSGTQPNVIAPGLFAAVPTLHGLRIEGCQLRSLDVETLGSLSGLRSLQLEKISLPGTAIPVTEDAFSKFSKLEKLQISEAQLETLPSKMFCHMPHLMVLNLSSNWLSESAFKLDSECAAKLIIVDLSSNKLASIAADTLSSFPSVRQLSLAHNRINFFHDAAFASSSLLQQLDLEGNRVDGLPSLPDTLIHVNLARNELRLVPQAIAKLPKLVSLNVSRNGIEHDTPFALKSPDVETVDMSFNRMGQLPSEFLAATIASLTHLHVEHNRIADIADGQLSNYTKLQTLNLASNRLQVLRDGILDGLLDLNLVVLSNNSLETIQTAAFADLTIAELDLSNNRFTEVPLAIGRLLKLRKINFRNNRISKLFKFVFNRSPHLHSIDLSNNELQTVDPYVFSDCPHLAVLDLSKNRIDTILKDSFIKCPLLRKLDLSHNRLVSFEESLGQAGNLKKLNLTANRIEILQWEQLPGKLEVLHADDNKVTLLGAGIQSKIRHASLRNNLIEQLSADQVPNTLESLDLSGNRIKVIAKDTFAAKSALKTLQLERNSLETVALDALQVTEGVHPVEVTLRDNPLKCSCELDWLKKDNTIKTKVIVSDRSETSCKHSLDGRKMQLNGVQPQDLLCEYERVCEPGCICCQFGSCDCRSICPEGCRCFRDATFSTNIVRCEGLNETQSKAFSPRDLPMSATHILLSRIHLPVLKAHSFLGRSKLKHLHLNASQLVDIQPMAFNTLPNLQLLDLSDNQLEKLTGEELHKTTKVTHLFLNGNRLRFFESGVATKLPNLQLVTLHNNLLEDISASLIESRSLVSVSLSANPFRCDCAQRFTAPGWMHGNKEKVIDYARTFCVENVTRAFRENDTTVLSAYPPNVGYDVFTMPIDDFVREANRSICVPFPTGLFGTEPQSSVLLIFLLIVCVLLLFGLLALGVAVARRTHNAMSQRRYKASSSLNCSSTTPGSSPLPLPLINFDAFVSYSKRDEKMVVEDICRPLEGSNYNLCLLHRDGPVYNAKVHTISDELISQMDAAQCLILVLTTSFLQNEWKTLQIKTSHQLFAKNRSKRVIAVMCEGVDSNLLDDELGQILRKSDRIILGEPLFWNLLRSRLPLQQHDHRSPHSECGSGGSQIYSGGSQIYSDLYGPVPSALV